MPAPLKNKKKIELLFRLGKKKSSDFFECRHLSSSESEGEIRFVVVAPKKNFPRAVDRNKIKRRLREILRKNDGVFKKNGFGWYMIIYTHSSFVDFDVLDKDVCSLFKK